ncbi:hypothetical protein BIW11_11214 [Tropilaelaps mercedesae]|uniref:non-specific serine/threonine protein kinase n=1 Tax=Tropilaelaps mercedesae TaxID=418985 RepID=A0A1V9XCE0_9ACAR|nr:hypothetical protein BIW11_11214 [Tropilaelaps mercedesae]
MGNVTAPIGRRRYEIFELVQGGRLSPTNTGSSSECSISILPRRTPPPPNPPISVSPQPSVASLGSSISLSSSTLSCPSKPSANGASGVVGHCLQVVPSPQQAAPWAVKKAKSQSPIIMHSVKATPIQKPVPQTAVAPPSRPVPPVPGGIQANVVGSVPGGTGSPAPAASGGFGTPPPYPCPPPAYPRRGAGGAVTVTTRSGHGLGPGAALHSNHVPQAPSPSPSAAAGSIASLSSSIASSSIPTTEPPSYASSVAALVAAASGGHKPASPTIGPHSHAHPHPPPTPPHQQQSQAIQPPPRGPSSDLVTTVSSICQSQVSALQGKREDEIRCLARPPTNTERRLEWKRPPWPWIIFARIDVCPSLSLKIDRQEDQRTLLACQATKMMRTMGGRGALAETTLSVEFLGGTSSGGTSGGDSALDVNSGPRISRCCVSLMRLWPDRTNRPAGHSGPDHSLPDCWCQRQRGRKLADVYGLSSWTALLLSKRCSYDQDATRTVRERRVNRHTPLVHSSLYRWSRTSSFPSPACAVPLRFGFPGTNHSQDNTNVDSSSSRSESPVTDSCSFAVGGVPPGGISAIGHLPVGPPHGDVVGGGGPSKDAEGGASEEPIRHQSPIPPRKKWSTERDDTKVRNYSPDAYKFFMEQHVENVMKNHHQRQQRRQQLETEMAKVGLSSEAQMQMRRMLHQKESNYIRLRRAKMEISMFHKIAIIGMGAFGEVALVKKVDTQQLYAMKTLRKEDVLKRNQVAHVKAERDILAEADNEWVVKLYYSFQDQNSLYFVMDYIAGGDMMTLLIKFGMFEESLARFYIAELTCALESVHKLGFIHRDIKPDNILIDRDGHIKLTDFGLCTGFRWTHNSKYYQRGGDHARQDSMDFNGCDEEDCSCKKPLERRRRKDQQRSLARSLVGTPNYIAPEVLLREGYGQACDWWSVGVILYEMLIGQAPFHAPKPAETQYKVINWETHLTFPPVPQLSPEANGLIRALCTSQEKRLGAKGATEIKAHPFFAGIDFEGGVRKTTAPYIPQIRYPADTSNFDKYEMPLSGMDDAAKGLNGMPPERDGEHAFLEFTFRRFFDDGGQAYPLRFAGQIQEEQETSQVDAKGNPVYV